MSEMRATLLSVLAVLVACDAYDNAASEVVAGVTDPDLKIVLQEQWDIDNPVEGVPPDRETRLLDNLAAARAIDVDRLSPADRLTLTLYIQRTSNLIDTHRCHEDPAAPIDLGCYQALIRYHLTTDVSPEELHRIGLDELAAVEAAIGALGTRMFGTANLAEIRAHLDADPAQRFADVGEILAAASALVDEATAASQSAFARMPSTPLEVGAGGNQADYHGLWDQKPVGTYAVATRPVDAQRRYDLPAVSFHESIPGHHLERARSWERRDLPWFRRVGQDTVYVEGWALYTEYLAEELGLYHDDTSRLGALSQRALRAARLVVDTGLHAMGWDRARAVAFLTEHTLVPAEHIELQVDRYLADPGQALAYVIGAREILRLRASAEDALGDRFSLRAFHERVLADGSLPLGLLTPRIEAWIAEQIR
jgi:uncharacterized protein (DUF885 family)